MWIQNQLGRLKFSRTFPGWASRTPEPDSVPWGMSCLGPSLVLIHRFTAWRPPHGPLHMDHNILQSSARPAPAPGSVPGAESGSDLVELELELELGLGLWRACTLSGSRLFDDRELRLVEARPRCHGLLHNPLLPFASTGTTIVRPP